MLQWEHSVILSIFIKLLLVIKIFVLSILEWPLKTGFTVLAAPSCKCMHFCVHAGMPLVAVAKIIDHFTSLGDNTLLSVIGLTLCSKIKYLQLLYLLSNFGEFSKITMTV